MIESKLDMNASWMVTFKIGIFLYGTEIQKAVTMVLISLTKDGMGKLIEVFS